MKRSDLSFPLHLIVHPFDGYWDLKYDGRGRVRIALIVLGLVVVSTIVQSQYAGFLVNYNDPRQLNSIVQLLTIVVPFSSGASPTGRSRRFWTGKGNSRRSSWRRATRSCRWR